MHKMQQNLASEAHIMDISGRIGIALAALLCTHAASLYFRTNPIEQDLLQQTRAALDNRGLNHIGITMSGRDMTLTGRVADRKTAVLALSIASRTAGVRVVHDQLRLTDSRRGT